MTLNKVLVTVALGATLLLAAGPPLLFAQDSHVGTLTGKEGSGKQLYRRFCIGCHGPQGDGNGENAQWIDPKPRDFTIATFKCRSTPTGTLPTDEDLYHAIQRGFVTTNMPSWNPLTPQQRADRLHQDIFTALESRKSRHAYPHSCRNRRNHRKHSPWARTFSENGMLEMSRTRRAWRRPIGFDAYRQ
jgi:mono/diheme cytochrome c family protein